MATTTTTTSPSSLLFSVLSSSHDNNEDFVNQLRNHLTQIETNVQQSLIQIQQRQPYTALPRNTNQVDQNIRNNFFDVLKDVAIKNNLPFDEPFFRQQFLEKQNSSSSPKVDIARAKPSIINETNDQHLSPVSHARRSQFAPVLSSTPVHQTSPITPIPVDLSMATIFVPPVFTVNSTDLPSVPPSAIVPQRANITRTAAGGRPPRIPRGESVTRLKRNPSPIKEQQDEVVIAKEVRITSKRRIKTKEEIIEDNIQVIIEQENEIILPDMIKQVQSTPLRGKKKKMTQEDNDIIPQLEPPPPPPVVENEIIPKKIRTGRSKKKADEEVINTNKPTRTASVRNRKKAEEDIPPLPPKKMTRNKKLVEPVINTDENLPVIIPSNIRASSLRGKKKLSEPIIIIPSSPKKIINKSKKRKDNEETNENSISIIKPPSPKRRGGRNTKPRNPSPPQNIITPPSIELEPRQEPVSTRSSRRGKKDMDLKIEKQEEIVLTKKTRNGRGKKANEPINTDYPVTVIDVVATSVTISAPVPSSSIDSLIAKPPRPPVVRKKKSIAMPPIPRMSPSTPPSSQRIQSTSPINDKLLLPLPIPTNGNRRRQQQRRVVNSPTRIDTSTNRNQKRTRSSVATTPKRARRDNLVVLTAPSTPGKKRNKCTCEKRRNRMCDICAAAIDA